MPFATCLESTQTSAARSMNGECECRSGTGSYHPGLAVDAPPATRPLGSPCLRGGHGPALGAADPALRFRVDVVGQVAAPDRARRMWRCPLPAPATSARSALGPIRRRDCCDADERAQGSRRSCSSCPRGPYARGARSDARLALVPIRARGDGVCRGGRSRRVLPPTEMAALGSGGLGGAFSHLSRRSLLA
jgi:hypothetical protein